MQTVCSGVALTIRDAVCALMGLGDDLYILNMAVLFAQVHNKLLHCWSSCPHAFYGHHPVTSVCTANENVNYQP